MQIDTKNVQAGKIYSNVGLLIIAHFEGLLIINHYGASTVFLELNLFIYVYMLCVCAKSL